MTYSYNVRSSDQSQFAVNANSNIPSDSIDCGIISLRWCRGAKCQQFATLRTFVIVLSISGILQGACEAYFRISAKQAALANGYDPIIVDWLLVSSGLFQVIFAFAFAYWAQRFHPISWLGGTIILQAITCLIAIIPVITNFSENDSVPLTQSTADNALCSTTLQTSQRAALDPEHQKILTLALLFVMQLGHGLGALAFFTIAIAYIDDNSRSIDSPAVIATVLGAKIWGLQVGSAISLGVGATSLGWWFGWAILAPLLFFSGVLLGLFPRRLVKTVIHQAAQRIIEESATRSFGSHLSTYIDDTDFWPTVKRLFRNKLLTFNALGIMFIQTASINYMLQEENYLQSRFHMPISEEDGLSQEWNVRFVSYFLKPPVAAISILVGGLIISKLKLSSRIIAGINIGMGISLIAIYIAYIFIKCDDVGPIAGVTNGKLVQPYCSRQCICSPNTFFPVCPENSTVTYFSPCYAGCSKQTNINNFEIFEGCSCGGVDDFETASWSNVRATEGACHRSGCVKMWILFQVMSLLTASIFGMSTIGKIVISLRSVLPQDKAMALAMQVMLTGLLAFVPGKLAYDAISSKTCIYWTQGYTKCLLRETPLHGNILNILSASLIAIGIVFDILVFIFVKGLNLYNCKVTDFNYTPSLYAPISNYDDGDHPPAGGSPGNVATETQTLQPRPTPAASTFQSIFRSPSSVTDSSIGVGSNQQEPSSGITYAQVVFQSKPEKATISNGIAAVKADIPLHNLSEHDVRHQLSNLKSFNPTTSSTAKSASPKPLRPKTKMPITSDIQTDTVSENRPKSPETDL